MSAAPAAVVRTVVRGQGDEHVYGVGLAADLDHAVDPDPATTAAAVHELRPSAAAAQSNRLHQPATAAAAVTGLPVDVQGVQAERAVVAVAAVGRRLHVGAAAQALERSVLRSAAHRPKRPSGIEPPSQAWKAWVLTVIRQARRQPTVGPPRAPVNIVPGVLRLYRGSTRRAVFEPNDGRQSHLFLQREGKPGGRYLSQRGGEQEARGRCQLRAPTRS